MSKTCCFHIFCVKVKTLFSKTRHLIWLRTVLAPGQVYFVHVLGSLEEGEGRRPFFCLSYIVLKVQLAAAPRAKTSLKPDLEQMQPSCFLLWHISTLSLAPAISRLLTISASELCNSEQLRKQPFELVSCFWLTIQF